MPILAASWFSPIAPAIVRSADPAPGEVDPSTYVLIGLLGVGLLMTLVVLVVIAFVISSATRGRVNREREAKPILDPGAASDADSDKPRVIRLKKNPEAEADGKADHA